VAARRPKTRKAKTAGTQRTKTSISLTPEAKRILSTLKAELRFRGHSASESDILEALLLQTDVATLARLVKG